MFVIVKIATGQFWSYRVKATGGWTWAPALAAQYASVDAAYHDMWGHALLTSQGIGVGRDPLGVRGS